MNSSQRVKRLWSGWLSFFNQLFINFPIDLIFQRREHPLAYRVRVLLEELGPIFVKFGQVISTRSELLPGGFLEELEKLQDKSSFFSPEQSRTIIEEELGASPEKLFSDFKDDPVAAASLAQVHQARLPEGGKVAVKVRRPGVTKTLSQDIDILYSLARWVERLAPTAQKIRMRKAVQEFERDINSELDFREEQRHLDEMRELLKEQSETKIPRTYPEICTRKVLVLEWIEGTKVIDVEQLKQRGHDPSVVAQKIGRIYLRQLLKFGVFHTDPHPGNLFVLEDGKIGLIDFGTLGRLDEEFRTGLRALIMAAANKDSRRIAQTLVELKIIPPEEEDSLEQELDDLMDRYYRERLEEIKLGRLIFQVLNQLIRKHDFHLPISYSRLAKVAITVENLCESLDPDYRWSEAAHSYKMEEQPGEVEWDMLKDRLKQTAKVLIGAPQRLDRALTQLESGSLGGPSVKELEEIAARASPSSYSLGLGLVTASLIGGGVFLLVNDGLTSAIVLLSMAALGFFRLLI